MVGAEHEGQADPAQPTRGKTVKSAVRLICCHPVGNWSSLVECPNRVRMFKTDYKITEPDLVIVSIILGWFLVFCSFALR